MPKTLKKTEQVDAPVISGSRTPPNRPESERSLLSCILSDADVALDTVSKLTEDDFYSGSHKAIIRAMRLVSESNKNIDISTLLDKLESTGKTEEAGGVDYVVGLGDIWAPKSQSKIYFDTVKRCSQLRKLINTCSSIIDSAYSSEDDQSTIAEAEKSIFDISDKNRIADITKLSESTYDVMQKLNEAHLNKGKIMGISTGLYGLDKYTSGFKPGNLVVLAAGTGVGKSSLAMNIVEHASKMGKKCAVFSLEMSKAEIALRLVCSLSGVSMKRAQDGRLNEEEWIRVNNAINASSKLPIFLDDSSAITAADILARCRRLVSRDGLDFVVVDYLQLIAPGESTKNDSRNQQVAAITRNLKIMAKELNLPVLALSQFSRDAAKRKDKEGKEPILADLRESGAIEQDSDIVIFIHRPGSDEDVTDAVQDVDIIVAKNRNGPMGKIQVKWLAEIVKFVNNVEEADALRKPTAERAQKKETIVAVEEEQAPPPSDSQAPEDDTVLPY